MSASAIEYTYRFPFASNVAETASASALHLAAAEQNNSFPYFFEGKLLQPRTTAQLLFMLSRLVSTRFYIPPNMLERLIAERDPVITSGGGLLRFEGFSACCSAYARIDLNPNAYDGEIISTGTTNVDFNSPMRAALAGVVDGDNIGFSVGRELFALSRGEGAIVEKKVTLPVRWLKGFVEVQSYQSGMEHRFTINKVETIRFLRSLPGNASSRSTFWVVPSGKGLRLSQLATATSVKIAGLNRLMLLKQLAPLADELTVFAHPTGEASEWQLRCGAITYNLTITAESYRGFSGEGQALAAIATAPEHQLALVRACLKWQSVINVQDIATQTNIPEASVKQILAVLGSRGLVGFDLNTRAYFHRELPFDLQLVEELHPRLKAARLLVANGLVKDLGQSASVHEFEVQGTDVKHRVRMGNGTPHCTCPWHTKHQGVRGPCKHVIAAEITLKGDEVDE